MTSVLRLVDNFGCQACDISGSGYIGSKPLFNCDLKVMWECLSASNEFPQKFSYDA